MRSLISCCLALGLLTNPAGGQEVPEYTKQREKAVNELVAACIKGGGLAPADRPDGKGQYLRVADREKLKSTLAARKDSLTPGLRDGLEAVWFRPNEPSQTVVAALLEAFGEVKQDRHALGLAVFFRARSLQRSLHWKEASDAYLAAEQHFEAARQPLLQAASLNNLGGLYFSRGAYEEALGYFKQALEMYRKLYPRERYKDGHPDLAQSLNNLGVVHKSRGSYEEALDCFQQALEMRRKLYPPERYKDGHPDFATCLYNLAAVHESRESYEEALGYYQQALEMRRKLYPPERYKDGHPDLASSLNNLGGLHRSRGMYEDALGYHKQALEMRRKLYPPERFKDGHPDLAQSLNNLGAVHDSRGAYEQARVYYQQALEMNRKLYPPERYKDGHPELASSLHNLGVMHESRGAYEEALGYAKQALEMRRKLYSPERFKDGHPDLARSLNNLGAVHESRGSYEEALGYSKQALEMRRKLYPPERYKDGHPDVANSLNNLGAVQRSRGSYEEALGYFKQALGMNRKLYPPERFKDGHHSLATSLNNLGTVYESRGTYEEALGCFKQALEMRRKLYPPEHFKDAHPDLANSFISLGVVHQSRGSYEEALGYYTQALAMQRKLYPPERFKDGHPHLAGSLNNLGLVHRSRGTYEEALGYLKQALAMRRKLYAPEDLKDGHPDLADSLSDLGAVHASRGMYKEALGYSKQALEMRRKLYPPQRYKDGHPDLALSLLNLGAVHESRGAYQEARKAYESAVEALRPSIGQGPRNWEAEPEVTARAFRPLPLTATCLSHRAWLLLKSLPAHPSAAELRRCERAYALAAAMQDRFRGEILRRDQDKLQHGEKADDLLHHRVDLLARLFEIEGKVADLEAAFGVLEGGRARLFLESLGEAHAATLAGLPDDLRKEERRLSLRLRELDARIERLQGQPGDEPARLLRQLSAERLKTEDEQKMFTDKLRQSHPQYAGFRYPKPCTVKQARDCLGKNEVALLFTVGDDASWVLLLEKEARPGHKGQGLSLFKLAGAKELDPLVDTLLAPQTLQRPALARPVADQLGQKVLGPLAKHIAGKELLIVADGTLGLLPFESMREDGHWLVEKHPIRYAPSLTALHLSRQVKRARTPTPLWALADPIFDRSDERARGLPSPKVDPRLGVLRGQGHERLRASGREVEAICQALGVSTKGILRDGDAKEVRVKEASHREELAKARFVHFATHGELGKDKTPQPRLVLGQVGNDDKEEMGGPNDGFLTLPEVTFLKLNAQVVVLSACQTGKGRRDRGEGVSGLARTFLYAGSKGVVCSLWSVDDARTAELMADFYAGLKVDKPTGEALRAAQLKMIQSGRAPFFWAPFVLMGE